MKTKRIAKPDSDKSGTFFRFTAFRSITFPLSNCLSALTSRSLIRKINITTREISKKQFSVYLLTGASFMYAFIACHRRDKANGFTSERIYIYSTICRMGKRSGQHQPIGDIKGGAHDIRDDRR